MKKPGNILLSKLVTDNEAVAAVEFAVVLPFLVLIFINVVSFYDGFRGDKAMTKVNSVLVDLATRDREAIDDADFDELVAIGEAIAGKYAVDSEFTVVISSIRNVFDADGDDDPELVWSRSNDDDAVITQSDVNSLDLPDIGEGESVIFVSTRAKYTPFLTNRILGSFTLSADQVRRPRFVSEVGCTSDASKC